MEDSEAKGKRREKGGREFLEEYRRGQRRNEIRMSRVDKSAMYVEGVRQEREE